MAQSDWPFLGGMPPGRDELQRQVVDGDPFLRLLGLSFDEARSDAATLSVAYRDDLTQPTGILHGGLQAILIDTAIAQALLTTIRPGFSVVTVRLDTNYFAPVRSGRIVAGARVVRKGKRIAHGEACVTDERDELVARGWGVFAVIGAPAPD
jgi:acyl-CoA thioesterase